MQRSPLAALADKQTGRLRSEREEHRSKFPTAAELIDLLRAGGIEGRIIYAENAQGDTFGRHPDSGVDWAHIRRALALPQVMKGRGKK